MKSFLLNIFFVFVLVCGWHAKAEFEVPVAGCENVRSEIGRRMDPVVTVLTNANGFADVTVRTSSFSFSPVVRRYRLLSGGGEQLFAHLRGQREAVCVAFKTFHCCSQECAARLKGRGYYVYALRKLII